MYFKIEFYNDYIIAKFSEIVEVHEICRFLNHNYIIIITTYYWFIIDIILHNILKINSKSSFIQNMSTHYRSTYRLLRHFRDIFLHM